MRVLERLPGEMGDVAAGDVAAGDVDEDCSTATGAVMDRIIGGARAGIMVSSSA